MWYAISVALLGLVVALVSVRFVTIGDRTVGDLPWALVYLVATAVLRSSSAGESALALIPVVCIALTGTGWRQLGITMAAATTVCIMPVIILGPVNFATLRAPLTAVVIAGAVGIASRLLVTDAREQAAVAKREREAVQRVADVVYGLFASRDVRADLCGATLRVGRAISAALFEPMATGAIRVTAQAGIDPTLVGASLGPDDPLTQLLKEGRQRLLNEIEPERLPSPEAVALWRRGGSPGAVLYQPLLRGSEPVGVLCVGWDAAVSISGPHVTAIGLLTHEAALLLTRADQMTRLTGMATTDPLTALPNRRAWEAKVEQVATQPGQLTVAMIDLDNFKRFNDTYGHLAGDALLRETADAWTQQLRRGDLLARIGGEEFGLLLYDTEVEVAYEIAERLRVSVTRDQTCCVGLAQRRVGEPIESVVSRADRALYEAKDAGRDLALTAS